MIPKAILLDWDGMLSLIRFWGHWRQTRPADPFALAYFISTSVDLGAGLL